MKFAIIKAGGNQHLVREGDVISITRASEGSEGENTLSFDEVLAVGEGEKLTLGTPTISGAVVSATLQKQEKGSKVMTLKYKPKARTRVKRGSRPITTTVRIDALPS